VLKVGKPGFNSLAESGQEILKVGIHNIGVGSRGREEPCPFLDFHA